MAEKKKVTYYLGTGRRKTAVARVRVSEGKGTIMVNERTLEDYFSEEKDRGAGKPTTTSHNDELKGLIRE